jgi:hypothetical protein
MYEAHPEQPNITKQDKAIAKRRRKIMDGRTAIISLEQTNCSKIIQDVPKINLHQP